MTPRDYLVSLGLAKPGRGKFSNEAKQALAKAKANGMTFDEPISVPKSVKTKEVKSRPEIPEVNAKAVRAWAKTNGIQVGARGRVHPDIITQYLAAGNAPKPEVVIVRPIVPKEVKVRPETVAYGRIPRMAGDGPHITEPIVAISSCGKCGKSITTCQHERPYMPEYLGGGLASLTKPVMS